MQTPTRIAITPGEPAGIGPELVLNLARQSFAFEMVAIASRQLLEKLARQLQITIHFEAFDPSIHASSHSPGTLKLIDIPLRAPVALGKPNIENSAYVIETLNAAIELVKKNSCQALTTGPVQKSIINAAGFPFSGHTEFIAEKVGGYPVMLLSNEAQTTQSRHKLRVALVTTHMPLAEVASQITTERIEQVISTLHDDLIRRFNIPKPCISVCGLNPHAGESGYLGKEEKVIIVPLLDELRNRGMNIVGPNPADTAFTQLNLAGKDAVVAMYHDQGLPVIKHSGFGEIVNITLGLPIIRTSVDHGTALDIAGQGIADVSSLHAAVSLAAKIANNHL